MKPISSKAPTLTDFGDLIPGHEAEVPILNPAVESALIGWLTEIWETDALKAVGLKPRARAMFHGPPGTGKTTLAHHLAGRLGLPILLVRPDRLIDAYLGATGQAIAALFAAARDKAQGGEGPVVLFFDEFEALAAARQAAGRDAQREINSSVNVLLQRLDRHDGFVIAATNRAKEIDPAVWRRFDLQVEIAAPGQREREKIIARYLSPYGLPAPALEAFAVACDLASPAILRALCEGIKRNLVIGGKLGWDMGREATFDRVISGIEPHPDLGKPRLWAKGATDKSIALIHWPLPFARDLTTLTTSPAPAPSPVVVPIRPSATGGRK